jgi:hypothetical protein
MNGAVKGLMVAALQVAIVASLGAKLLYDRATQPRVWVQTAPVDPNLPIRGRYVRLRLLMQPRGLTSSDSLGSRPGPRPVAPVTLLVEGEHLVAQAVADQGLYDASDLHARLIEGNGQTLAVLDEPVAFFIPEHVADPSRRAPGEQLWVEATIPKRGPPRPIRLGVRRGDGPIEPLTVE